MFTILFTVYINKPSSGFCQEKIKKNKKKEKRGQATFSFEQKKGGQAPFSHFLLCWNYPLM
jgi:hypothetical protein